MNSAEKLAAAILILGERWVLHPARRVQRLTEGQQVELHKADVTATFKRVRRRLAQASENLGN